MMWVKRICANALTEEGMRKLVNFRNGTGLRLWVAIGLFCLFTPVLDAASFMHVTNGVWSSGFTTGGTQLPQNVANTLDPHFGLIQLPVGCTGVTCTQDGTTPLNSSTFVVQGPSGVFPFVGGGWMANTSSSLWIGPRSNQTDPDSLGTTFPNVGVFASDTSPYVYRTTFDLTALGLNPLTAAIALGWQSDNYQMSAVRLCQISSASDPVCNISYTIGASGNLGHAAALTALNIQHGVNATFGSGLMALDFIVYNTTIGWGGNPSGLRVEITSATADEAGVPEPATGLLIGAALVLLGWRRRC
jgi:hypothetical protein